jgi:hypothetical protein
MTDLITHRDVVERMPLSMAKRPRDHRGYPVPWFTPWHEGRWDFRYVEPGKVEQALREERCWTCGERLELPCAFVVGPMCAVNRTSAEPPSHVNCALYAARACPFLARPKMERPSGHAGVHEGDGMPGIALMRNPGVALVWITSEPSYDPRARLFDLGEPERVRWFAHSQPATREQIMESIDSGLPHLQKLAEQDGPEAVELLTTYVERALTLLPEPATALHGKGQRDG